MSSKRSDKFLVIKALKGASSIEFDAVAGTASASSCSKHSSSPTGEFHLVELQQLLGHFFPDFLGELLATRVN